MDLVAGDREPAEPLGRAVQDPHRCAVGEGGDAAQVVVPHVEDLGAGHVAGGHDRPPVDVVALDPGEVQGHAPAGWATVRGLAVHLDAADPGRRPLGEEGDHVAVVQLTGPGRPRDDGAEAGADEPPVDRQSERAAGVALAALEPAQDRDHVVQSLSGHRGRGDDRLVGQERPGDDGGDVGLGELEQLGVDEIRHGEDDGPLGHAEELEDREVLPGLGHDAVDGRDAEQHGVDAGGAGDHGAHEPLVARDVDERDATPIREVHRREPERDGDPPRLLFGSVSRSTPVSARTSDVFPWSMCPAVPTMTLAPLKRRPSSWVRRRNTSSRLLCCPESSTSTWPRATAQRNTSSRTSRLAWSPNRIRRRRGP